MEEAVCFVACQHPPRWLVQVREAVTILDLDVAYYPCPAGGPTWRQKVKQKGGKASFPYMVDPNTGDSASHSVSKPSPDY